MGYEFELAMLTEDQQREVVALSHVHQVDSVTEAVVKTTNQKVPRVNKNDKRNDDDFPFGSVSLSSFSRIPASVDPKYTKGTATSADNSKKVGVGGNAEFWIRPVNHRAYGVGARIEMMPARNSYTPGQGQRVPGAGAGMEIKTRANIARLPIAGSVPVYQHMGIAEEVITFVGAFVGFDNPVEKVVDGRTQSYIGYDRKRIGNAWDEAMNVVEQIRNGYELEIVMRWNTSWNLNEVPDDLNIEYMPGIKYRGYVRNFAKEFATAQRVYYRIEFVITNRESHLMNEKAQAPSLAPTVVKGMDLAAGVDTPTPAPEPGIPPADPDKKSNKDYAAETKGMVPISVNEMGNGKIYVNYENNPAPNLYGTKAVMPNPISEANFPAGRGLTSAKLVNEDPGSVVVTYVDAATGGTFTHTYVTKFTREKFIATFIQPVLTRFGGGTYKPEYGKVTPVPTAKKKLDNPKAPVYNQPPAPKPTPVKPTAPPKVTNKQAASTIVDNQFIVPKEGTYQLTLNPQNGETIITYSDGSKTQFFSPSKQTLKTIYTNDGLEKIEKMTQDQFNRVYGTKK